MFHRIFTGGSPPSTVIAILPSLPLWHVGDMTLEVYDNPCPRITSTVSLAVQEPCFIVTIYVPLCDTVISRAATPVFQR